MKKKTYRLLLAGIILFAATVPGCGKKQEIKLVNEQNFTPSEAGSIRLDYDNDDITLLESSTSDIILKEYMDIDKSSYYARINNRDGELSISEGKRPGGNRLDCYVELYLPADFGPEVFVHTTKGTFETKFGHPLTALHAETTSGTLKLDNLQAQTLSVSSANGTVGLSNAQAETISIDTTNAEVNANNIHGAIRYTTSNGSLVLTAAHGSGNFEASSDGRLDITV